MNQNILRRVNVSVDMKRINKVINTRATFNQRDVKTAVLLCNLSMEESLNLSDCTVTAEILKPDGTEVVVLCQILDAEKGVVAVGLTNQCLMVPGEARCELTVRSNTQTLYSPVLIYNVNDNLFDLDDEDLTSLDEYPVLTQLISEVQTMQQALYALEVLIQTNEADRDSNENIRQDNETARQTYINQVKDQFTQMVRTFDEKVALVNSEVAKMQNMTNDKMLEVDAKVNAKITEINNTINNINSVFESKVNLIDSKMAVVNTKLSDMDKSMRDMNTLTTNKINEMNTATTTKMNEMTSTTNTNVDKMHTTTNAKINEMTKIITDNTNFVNNKCKEIDTTISDTNKLISDVEIAETSRNQAEVDRQTSYDALIAELAVTTGDIDDILGMIGGL